MLNNEVTQPSKSGTKNWVKIHDDVLGKCNTNSQIKFKTTIWNSSLCNYLDTNILAKGTITVVGQGEHAAGIAATRNGKKYLKTMPCSTTA